MTEIAIEGKREMTKRTAQNNRGNCCSSNLFAFRNRCCRTPTSANPAESRPSLTYQNCGKLSPANSSISESLPLRHAFPAPSFAIGGALRLVADADLDSFRSVGAWVDFRLRDVVEDNEFLPDLSDGERSG